MDVRLSESECKALCLISGHKACGRSDAFKRYGMAYSASEPAIVSLVEKGLLAINKAGAIRVKDRDVAREVMFCHECPQGFFENAGMYFGEKARATRAMLDALPEPPSHFLRYY